MPVQADLILAYPNLPSVTGDWSSYDLDYLNCYHNSSMLEEELYKLNNTVSELVDLEIIGQSYFGKNIYSVKITNELRTQQKAKTLVVAHHHGNEQISLEIALRFMVMLVKGYSIDTQIKHYIDTQEIYIIPTINPDSLDLVVDGKNDYLRKNARPFDDDNDGLMDEDPIEDVNGDGIISAFDVYEKNGTDLIHIYRYYEGIDNDGDGKINEDPVGYVDLNRNYDFHFRDGVSYSNNSLDRDYPGEIPFSEIETQTYRDFALQHTFSMAYSLHSGVNSTFFFKNSHMFLEEEISYNMINDLSALLPSWFGYNDRFVNDPGVDVYWVAGNWDGWSYFLNNIIMPISLELYRNGTIDFFRPEDVVVDNSTHLIMDFKYHFNLANPEADYIDDLWIDVKPYFPYLLENTPRLEIIPTLLSEKDLPSALVNLTFKCKNISPRIHTVESVNVYDTNNNLLSTGKIMAANSEEEIEASFELPATYNGSYEIKVGNEYVGYYHYFLNSSPTNQPPQNDTTKYISFHFSIIGLSIIPFLSCKFKKKGK